MFAAVVSLVVCAAPVLVDATVGFKKADVVFVAVDGANLRATADIKGALVAVVDFGAAVTVVDAGPVVDLFDIKNRWYQVKTAQGAGFVFGNVVSNLAGSGNLDDDKAVERWAVAASSTAPVLRVFSGDDAHAIASRDLDKGVVSVFDVGAVDGRGFVGVRVCAAASCVDRAHTLLRNEVRVVVEQASAPEVAPKLVVTKALVEAALNNAYDVKVRPALTADQLTAFFARNGCNAVADLDSDEMGQARSQPACHAKDFSQNCSADSFDCDSQQDACEERCGDRCDGCQAKCGGTCDACTAKCTDALCRRACAKSRGQCFTACLDPVAACRTACEPAATRCWEAGRSRVQSQCNCSADADDLKQQSPWCQERCAEQNQ